MVQTERNAKVRVACTILYSHGTGIMARVVQQMTIDLTCFQSPLGSCLSMITYRLVVGPHQHICTYMIARLVLPDVQSIITVFNTFIPRAIGLGSGYLCVYAGYVHTMTVLCME